MARTLPIGLVHSSVSFALEQGWDINGILEAAEISPFLLGDDRSRITDDQLVRLVQAMWRSTDDELLGLGTHPLPRGTFRLLCYALLGSGDLGEALARVRGFLRAAPAIPLTVESDDKTTALVLDARPSGNPAHLLILIGLAAAHRVFSWMLDRNLKLVHVTLPFSTPEDLEDLRYAFDAAVVFDAPKASIVFANRWLSYPLVRDQADIEEFVNNSPRAILRPPRYRSTFADQVRRLVDRGLRRGDALDAASVAEQLAVSQQTMRRRLAKQDTSFRQLSEEVRRDVAVTALVAGRESIAELAARLGYSEPSAFSRAFRGWTGSAPGAYRAVTSASPNEAVAESG